MKNKGKNRLFFGIIGALIAFLGLVACDRKPQQQMQMPPPEVSFVVVSAQPVTLTTELPGRTSPFRISEIRPQLSGLIQKRLFEEGAEVKAGQVLYQIEPAPFQAALENTQASLARAEANLPAITQRVRRYAELLPKKAISQQEYDDAEAALQQALAEVEALKAAVKAAKINLEYTKITAPISGRIGISNVTEGAMVTAYQPLALATIQQLDPIYVNIPRSTTELLKLRRQLEEGKLKSKDAHKISLILEDNTAYQSDGVLNFQDITVDPSVGSVVLRAVFPNAKGVLLPNMFVRAILREGEKVDAILLPQQAVTRDSKGNSIAFIVNKQGVIELKILKIDRAISDKWLVTSGLELGDQVIVEGLQKIRPGMPVKATPFDASKNKPDDRSNTHTQHDGQVKNNGETEPAPQAGK